MSNVQGLRLAREMDMSKNREAMLVYNASLTLFEDLAKMPVD